MSTLLLHAQGAQSRSFQAQEGFGKPTRIRVPPSLAVVYFGVLGKIVLKRKCFKAKAINNLAVDCLLFLRLFPPTQISFCEPFSELIHTYSEG